MNAIRVPLVLGLIASVAVHSTEATELEVSITIDPKVEQDGRVIVRGTTNLPPETKLSVSISDAVIKDRTYACGASVRSDGTYKSELLGPTVGVGEGWYVATVIMPVLGDQPKHVQRIIGEKATNLVGPLVSTKYAHFGKYVRAEKKFRIGNKDAGETQLATMRQTTEELKETAQQIKNLFDRLETAKREGRFDRRRHSAFERGATFKQFYNELVMVTQRRDAIRGFAGLTLGWPLADLSYMLISAKDGNELDYLDGKADFLKDYKSLQEFIQEREGDIAKAMSDAEKGPSQLPSSGDIPPAKVLNASDSESTKDTFEFREWKSRNGRHSQTAKFVKYASGKVTLENKDGKQITLPITQLDRGDYEYVQKQREKKQAYSSIKDFEFTDVTLKSGHGFATVLGQVTNNSRKDFFLAKFIIRLYDDDDKLVEMGSFDVGDLRAGQTKSFEAPIVDSRTDTIGRYRMQLEQGF